MLCHSDFAPLLAVSPRIRLRHPWSHLLPPAGVIVGMIRTRVADCSIDTDSAVASNADNDAYWHDLVPKSNAKR